MKKFEITYSQNFYQGSAKRIYKATIAAKNPAAATEKLLAEIERKSQRLGRMPYVEILSVNGGVDNA